MVAATWGLDHFVAIVTVRVTYISDYGLYAGTAKQTPPPENFGSFELEKNYLTFEAEILHTPSQ